MVFVSKEKKNGKKKELFSTGQEKWGWWYNMLIQKKTQHTSPSTMQSCIFSPPSFTELQPQQQLHFPFDPTVRGYHRTVGKGEKTRDPLPERSLTLQFLSSGVVSSNSSPSLKLISVFLKVLWVLITTLSPSLLMITVGLVTFPTCRIANPTPTPSGKSRNHHPLFGFCLFVCFTPFRPHTWAQTILPPLYSFGTPQCDAASRFASIPAHPSLHVGAALDHPARSPSSAAGPGPPGWCPCTTLISVCLPRNCKQSCPHPTLSCDPGPLAAIPTRSTPRSHPASAGKEKGALVLPSTSRYRTRGILIHFVFHCGAYSRFRISRSHLPSAFMYSSKLWLSASFHVAQKASTMAAGAGVRGNATAASPPRI